VPDAFIERMREDETRDEMELTVALFSANQIVRILRGAFDTPRQQMDRWWNQQKIAAGLAAPAQGELFAQQQTPQQAQRQDQAQVIRLTDRPRPTLVQ